MENKWKTIAIIFIVLFVSLSFFNILLFVVGKGVVDDEIECFLTCEEYYTSYYNSDTQMCYCSDEDYQIVKEKYIK